MKKIIFILMCLYSISYAQKPKHNSYSINDIAFAEREAHSRILHKKELSAASDNFYVTYYRLEWQVDPAVQYITGIVTPYFITSSAADSITFDLVNQLQVDSVKQKSSFLPFSQGNNTLTINFDALEPTGTLDSVSIYYHGIPLDSEFGTFVNSVHDSVPILWTLSEPYGSCDWWPCRNGLDDKADSIDVIITAPSQYAAVSNGLRQSEIISGTNTITHWKHRYPIATYLICMAVSNYSEFENYVLIGDTNLLMQTFCYPEDLAAFQTNTPLVLTTMQYYSSFLGNYPFLKEKYGQVEFGFGGGQEHQTSTFIEKPENALMAHELAHHWFGDKVTCGSWQDIWLNEGFATHLASMNTEYEDPATAIPTRKSEINTITSIPNGSVFVDDTTNIDRIFNSRLSYTKGSHLLYMLRWILTDSVFFKGLRMYLTDPLLSYGFARTKDLQRNLEAASGVNLDYFFNDWFYGQGYPSYNVQWTQIGNDYVKIKMNQTTSDSSVSFFALPVALQFQNATQQKTIVVNNTSNGQIFYEDIGFIADSVTIDPDYWLISANDTAEEITGTATGNNVIQVFPNPFTDNFDVYLQNFNSPNANLKIYDARGRLMLNENLSVNGSFFSEVNTQTFARGIYFIKIQTDNGVKFVKKILKQ